METTKIKYGNVEVEIPQKGFAFVGVIDHGHTGCPHCGAEGRYIYTWAVDGKLSSAMAGCYKVLTAKYTKDSNFRYFELLAEKQAKGKPLNGWDKNIIRLQEFLKEGKYDSKWIFSKINEVLSQRKDFLKRKGFAV